MRLWKRKKERRIPPTLIRHSQFFSGFFTDKTDFPLTTRNRIKSSASGGRAIALDRVLSTEVQLIIVKLDRRYFIRRQERGDGAGRFHGSLTYAEMDRQRVALTTNTPNYFAYEGSDLLIYGRSLYSFGGGRERRGFLTRVPWFSRERKDNPITILIIGRLVRDLPITTLTRLHRFGRRPGVNATVVLCNIPLRGRPTILLLSRLSDSLRREISVVTSPRPFIPPEMKQILWLAGRRFEFKPVFRSWFPSWSKTYLRHLPVNFLLSSDLETLTNLRSYLIALCAGSNSNAISLDSMH